MLSLRLKIYKITRYNEIFHLFFLCAGFVLPTLGYSPNSGISILHEGNKVFKDLNRNGKLDVYEDWRKDINERAIDLAGQLSKEEITGLMLYSSHLNIPAKGAYGAVRLCFQA